MERFAVDFVILPPAPVTDVAISLNKRLCNADIVLDEENCFPHLSLLMGCLRLEDLARAQSILKTIGSQHKKMKLNIPGIRTVGATVGDVIALDIEPNNELQALHECVVNAFASLLSTDATGADVLGNSSANDSALVWINSFIQQSSFDNFWPHITAGYLKAGVSSEAIEPFSFTASRLAICHLGNYCTCRKILSEASLAG
ncbi:MAG TPA: 2'-5' RNA ligase family protein [Chryseolinea sp.]|nr:2'-5' RNA ligase family protein [Chryseolinea sp.]